MSRYNRQQEDSQEWPPAILVPESSPTIDPKLARLQQVFGFSKPLKTLKEALDAAHGSVDLAIVYAACENDLPKEGSPLVQDTPIKRRKLFKKSELIQDPPTPLQQSSDSDDLEILIPSPPPRLHLQEQSSRYKVNRIHVIQDSSPAKIPKKESTTVHEILDDDDEEEEAQEISDTDSEDPRDDYKEQGAFETATVIYFNSCTIDQLQQVTACSQDQANFIIGLRPFESFYHLQNSLSQGKKKLASILDKYQETMEGYAQVDALIERCRVYGEELNTVLKAWGLPPSNDPALGELSMIDLPSQPPVLQNGFPELLLVQPDFINPAYHLKSYQLLGISWLHLLYSKGLGGILADEMGLGKTAQVIAFLGFLRSKGIKGPHLIVAPSSTLENWMREIEKWCPSLTFRSYYGQQAERFESQAEIKDNIEDIDIVVTTYNMATGNKDDRSFLRKLGCTSMILDEGRTLLQIFTLADMIKNMESARYKYLSRFDAGFRLLMTGTPLQNNLMELLSLLTFIMPELFSSDMGALSKIFAIKRNGHTTDEENLLSKQRVQRAKEIMTPFVLRRRKDQVVKELPKKIITIQSCDPSDYQHSVYQDVLKESRKTYLEATSVESTSKSVQKKAQAGANKKLSNVLMQLRKVANHPLLMRHHYNDEKLRLMARQIMREPEYCDANQEYIFEDMQYMSDFELHKLCNNFPKSMKQFGLGPEHWMDAGKVQALQKMLPEMKARGDRILIFSQFVIMLDVLEKVMETLDIQQGLIDQYNTDADITVFLISTKAGGIGINLTSANVVIIYDMDFNPHNDAQAEDRAHRVGQTRDVNVIKFVLSGTVEEHILRCATTKIKLDERIRGGNEEPEDESEWLDENVMEALRNEIRRGI